MPHLPKALWLNVSPHLQRFDQPLLCQLARHSHLQRWEYHQTIDEPCCLETAVSLLHDHLNSVPQPVHLIGHGLAGVVGLLYARRWPQRVRSLTLLSVGVQPLVTWQSHYYALRRLLPCSRQMVLVQMVQILFGPQPYNTALALAAILEKELDNGFYPGSLVNHSSVPLDGVEVPLMISHGADDVVVDARAYQDWRPWLKARDWQWNCPRGRYFFHHTYPKLMAQQIQTFWQSQVIEITVTPFTLPPFQDSPGYSR